MFLVKVISCFLWGLGQCFFRWILLFERAKGNGFLTFEFGEYEDNGHCILSILQSYIEENAHRLSGRLYQRIVTLLPPLDDHCRLECNTLTWFKDWSNNTCTKAYQIAWSLSLNFFASARFDMKVWMASISFVLPASIPPESWNTNPGLLSKTNSSSMLWSPRWEGY